MGTVNTAYLKTDLHLEDLRELKLERYREQVQIALSIL